MVSLLHKMILNQHQLILTHFLLLIRPVPHIEPINALLVPFHLFAQPSAIALVFY